MQTSLIRQAIPKLAMSFVILVTMLPDITFAQLWPGSRRTVYSVTEIAPPASVPVLGFSPRVLNNAGDVAGLLERNDETGIEAFIWRRGRTMLELPGVTDHGFILDMNDAGTVLGLRWDESEPDSPWYPLMWRNGVTTYLERPSGWMWYQHLRMNNRGQVAGYAWIFDDFYSRTEAFLWDQGHVQVLPPLPGTFYAWPLAINDAAQVVGLCGSRTADGRWIQVPCIWRNGQVTQLGSLGSDSAVAYGINNRGDVVGCATDRSGMRRGVIWNQGQMRALPLLPGGAGACAQHVNAAGLIVGTAERADGGQVAALWVPEGGGGFWGGPYHRRYVIVDLNALVPAGTPLLGAVQDVNDRGEILCEIGGMYPADTGLHYAACYLLSPRWQPGPSFYHALPRESHAP